MQSPPSTKTRSATTATTAGSSVSGQSHAKSSCLWPATPWKEHLANSTTTGRHRAVRRATRITVPQSQTQSESQWSSRQSVTGPEYVDSSAAQYCSRSYGRGLGETSLHALCIRLSRLYVQPCPVGLFAKVACPGKQMYAEIRCIMGRRGIPARFKLSPH